MYFTRTQASICRLGLSKSRSRRHGCNTPNLFFHGSSPYHYELDKRDDVLCFLLTTIRDNNFLERSTAARAQSFDGIHNFCAFHDFSKDHVIAVQPRRLAKKRTNVLGL